MTPELIFRFRLCLYDSNGMGSFIALSWWRMPSVEN